MSEYWIINSGRNIKLGSYRLLVTSLPANQYITWFYVCFCLKTSYLKCTLLRYIYVSVCVCMCSWFNFPGGAVVKNLPANAGDAGLIPGLERIIPGEGNDNPLLAWEIPWTKVPGGLQSMGSQRVGHDWATEHTHAWSWFTNAELTASNSTAHARMKLTHVFSP